MQSTVSIDGRLAFAIFVVLWAITAPRVRGQSGNYLFPAKDVDPAVLKSDGKASVAESEKSWSFAPVKKSGRAALLFFPGGGVEPKAYAPLARAVANEGWTVHLVKLPVGFALPDKHRQNAIAIGKDVIKAHPEFERWVVGGHSMGGSIAAKFVHEEPTWFAGLILIATTHPRDFDISAFRGDVVKVSGTEDRVAPIAKSEANKKWLPAGTTWIKVDGGNHAQFGSYGKQPGDGVARITAEKQKRLAVEAIIESMARISK